MASAPTTPMPIETAAQEAVVQYLQSALDLFATSYNVRNQMVQRDLAYYREQDQTTAQARAKSANQSGDASKMQNVTMPVVMPQVETQLSNLQEIFLTGYPIFGVVAPPEELEQMQQMETIIGENSLRAGWPLNLLQTMRDGLKYDLGAVEVVWQTKKVFAVTTPEEKSIQQGASTETQYAGNFITRLDPYNVILDPRVSPEKIHTDGEFAGYTEIVSRIQLKKRMEDLSVLATMNFKKAFESPGPGSASYGDINAPYYEPSINPDALLPVDARAEHNWLNWVGLAGADRKDGIQYKNSYEYTTLYARILPSDFKISGKNRNHVQIWKFIVINRSVVIFAERQTNAHNYLPIIVCKPSADGMGWQSKSFAENAIPYQQVASSLTNSGMESQRRKVYDRVYYDASRINKKDIDQVSSVARIAVKNSAYGKPISEAVHESPYRDDGVAEIMSMGQQVAAMADVAVGQNRVQQGQFQKGNKTRKEFDTVMGNANSRSRMLALGLEFSFYVPIKEIVKSNILQYQGPVKMVNSNTQQPVQVDPQKLREASIAFTLSDGYLPSEKLLSTEVLGMVFQAAQALPAIAAEYDLMGMFTYSMQLQGGGWTRQFKRTPEEAQAYMQTMQQASLASGQANPPPAAPPTTGAPA